MYDGTELRAFTAQRVETANDRGVGAAFSAAIAAGLANGLEVRDAVSQAKKYVTGALRHALPIGARGTVNHFHEMRSGGSPSAGRTDDWWRSAARARPCCEAGAPSARRTAPSR